MVEDFNEDQDYYTKSDDFKRKNYKAYLLKMDDVTLLTEVLVKVRTIDPADPDYKKKQISKWDRMTIADVAVDAKYGKEED